MADQIVKMSPLRRTIAQNLRNTLQNNPQISSFYHVDVTELLEYKKELAQKGIEVTVTGLIVKAVVQSLEVAKYLNSRINGNEYTIYESISPCIAMQTERGLFVPVLRDAQNKGAAEITSEIRDMSNRINAGQMTMDDMKGGTITISSPGGGRTEMFQSILHDNQCMLIGIGRISKQAVVMPDNSIQVRSMVWLANNINHAIVDGKAVAPFTLRMCEILEHPKDNLII